MSLTIPQGDSAPMVVEHLPGGITRVSAAAPTGTDTRGDPLRGGVADGTHHRFHADGRVEQFGAVTKSTTADLVNNSSDDLMQTLRSPAGTPVAREVRYTDRVFIGGGIGEIDVRTALTMGYLRQTAPGQFVSTGKHLTDRGQ